MGQQILKFGACKPETVG